MSFIIKTGTIYEGTSNIQLNTIAKCLEAEGFSGNWTNCDLFTSEGYKHTILGAIEYCLLAELWHVHSITLNCLSLLRDHMEQMTLCLLFTMLPSVNMKM